MSNSIDVSTLERWLEEDRPVSIIDIRPQDDFEEWRIPTSRHMTKEAALELDSDEQEPVVTICQAGNTSQRVADRLAGRGLEAYSLAGGMKAWSFAWNVATTTLANGVRISQIRRTGKGCLSYHLESANESLVIDPALPVETMLSYLEELPSRVVGVLDTHVHADHVSRGDALARTLGVPYHLPDQERVACEATWLTDGDQVPFGRAVLQTISTPGHTWESACYVLPGAVFTGDTLFLESVGRPDLHADRQEIARRAGDLYDSLQRILGLPDDTLVLPAHAPEPLEFDGRLWAERIDRVAERVELLALERDDFVEHLANASSPAPRNHEQIVALNEACEVPADTTELEAGANRCGVRS